MAGYVEYGVVYVVVWMHCTPFWYTMLTPPPLTALLDL